MDFYKWIFIICYNRITTDKRPQLGPVQAASLLPHAAFNWAPRDPTKEKGQAIDGHLMAHGDRGCIPGRPLSIDWRGKIYRKP